MKKKISYLIILLMGFICFQNLVSAIIVYNPNAPVGEAYFDQKELSEGETYTILDVKFSGMPEVYRPSGWTVRYDSRQGSQYLCKGNVWKDCSEDERLIVTSGSTIKSPVSSLSLEAQWDIKFVQWETESSCEKKGYVWNKDGYCNTDNLQYVMCGDAHDIPAQIPSLISMAVNLLKIATPIVLIIVSIITLVKATMASKEDEIKKAQQSLVRKVIAAVMVFMIISIVQFVVLKVADDEDQKSIPSCMSCFLNNNCRGVKYFKNNVNGQYFCTKVNNPSEPVECESFYESTPNYNKIPEVVTPQNTN